ncbi:MAG: hypothetical protein MUC44_14150 [Beijerinckiaceae bacterium]|jgi:hypothetical protein|nr:hypothetical protein [Beijerinckiaceae bacterium]
MNVTTMMTNLVDHAQAHAAFGDIARASPGAIAGLSHTQAKQVMDALDVKSIADLATCRHVLWAQAITTLAKQERTDLPNPGLTDILDPSWQKKKLRDLAKASPSVLAGLSEKEAKLLSEALNVRSIADLATNTFILKAQVIAHLATFAKTDSQRAAA